MMLYPFLPLAILLIFSHLFPEISGENEAFQLRTYIVHVRSPANAAFGSPKQLEAWYRSFLPKAVANSSQSRIVYSYSEAITGFAARLTEEEVEEVAKADGFLEAHPDRTLSLLTTHTPAFLGLQPGSGFWNGCGFGKGVIIGLLDTGVTPAHPSFDDNGMHPPPSRWKEGCSYNNTFRCNNKLIGAKSFINGFRSDLPPIDHKGHGTHTASTAAGNFVRNANVLGNGNGTASGLAPRAHLAVYQVCTSIGCLTSDVLAGMDAAIKDGVDVISISLGGGPFAFDEDPLAIAAFAAAQKGIFVSCAGGNAGPGSKTVANGAPWVLTVAASTMDRNIRVTVKLGNDQEFDGQSVFQPDNFSSTMMPLVLPNLDDDGQPGNCRFGNLNQSHIRGKMVLCHRGDIGSRIATGSSIKDAGGAAMILMNGMIQGYTTFAEAHILPVSHVSYADGAKILSYMNSSSNATAAFTFKGTITGTSQAPSIAYFSSRGPSWPSPGILKPDITGPGVNVLAAWPFQVGPLDTKHGAVDFNVISGTSMSTPHLSGIAALVKSAHPEWSPAAIKSAIMTTADTNDHDGEPIKDEQRQPASFFLMGAGHVNPSKAADPGLVYDLNIEDYVAYLCGLGYTDRQVKYITRHNTTCASIKKIKEAELNYPSITVSLKSGHVVVNRTVTNVGEATSTYKVQVGMPKGVSVTVKPKTLRFSKVNEKKSFTVSVSGSSTTSSGHEGSLKWVSDKHVVRSPLVILPDD